MAQAPQTTNGRWRTDIDALEFRPAGHDGLCVVHRLALKKLLARIPEPADCLGYFDAQREAFEAAARTKIDRQGLAPLANFHLTSRDIARQLTAPAGGSSVDSAAP